MSKSKYCQDCGGPLLNPDRCSCGWKSKAAEKGSGKNYPGTCMVADCKSDTDVVTWVNDQPITRCCWHYTQDLQRAGRNQLRFPKVTESESITVREKLQTETDEWLKGALV